MHKTGEAALTAPINDLRDFEYPVRAEQNLLEYYSWANSCLPVPKEQSILRKNTNKLKVFSVEQRLANNPIPDEFEKSLGVFVEDLDIQVRDAVVMFNNKGYQTTESGFTFGGAIQAIVGNYILGEETKTDLADIGMNVFTIPTEHQTIIAYKPEYASIGHMKRLWDWTADILPDLTQPQQLT
ncbi:MAG: hypothetical protein NVS1B10_04960 [Candidatus Saccharimonadales bacterium]